MASIHIFVFSLTILQVLLGTNEQKRDDDSANGDHKLINIHKLTQTNTINAET